MAARPCAACVDMVRIAGIKALEQSMDTNMEDSNKKWRDPTLCSMVYIFIFQGSHADRRLGIIRVHASHKRPSADTSTHHHIAVPGLWHTYDYDV